MMEHDSAPGQSLTPPSDRVSGVELRHLRYLVAVAEAGDGLHLTAADSVLLEESRTVLPMFEHGLRRSRQAAGLDRRRLRLRFVVPPDLPESLADNIAIRLRSVATGAGVQVIWLEAPVDAEFSVMCRRQADAALGWQMSDPAALPDPLDAIELGQFEPGLWIPAGISAGDRRVMSLDELVGMDVVHGPGRASPVVYDAWLAVLRGRRPCFEFIDPPSRHCLAAALAFAATASRPTAVLSRPLRAAGDEAIGDVRQHAGDGYDMVRVRLDRHPLTARAAVAWSGDLPRYLQQVVFDTADAGWPLLTTPSESSETRRLNLRRPARRESMVARLPYPGRKTSPQQLQDFLALATDRGTGAHCEPSARRSPGGNG